MTLKEVFGSGGPISRAGSLLADILIANLTWFVLGGPAIWLVMAMLPWHIPTLIWNLGEFSLTINLIGLIFVIVLIGPATTAIFAALGKTQRHEESYILKDFWKSFRQNFVQALITIPLALFALMMIYSAWVEINNQALFGPLLYVTIPVQIFVGVEIIFLFIYMYPLLARFEMPTKDLLKYSLLMANKHLPSTLIIFLLFVATLAATFLWNLGIGLFGFGVYVYLACFLLERVFKNYMPEEDLDSDYLGEEEVRHTEKVRKAVRSADEKAKEQIKNDRQAIIDKYTKKKND